MARLCIRITPNNHPTDSSLDAMRTQLGDVVCVVNDGHVFSKGELNCGHYRFIDVTGATQEDMVSLVEPLRDADEKILKVRRLTLDVSVLTGGVWKTRTTATKAQIDLITIVRV